MRQKKPARCRSISIPYLILLFLLPVFPLGLLAQADQQDEKPENLKVLPETMSVQQVRRVMFQFNNALGVRCIHCHVGEAGEPLSTYDFAADDKETKETARAMLRMAQAINDDHIQQLPGDEDRLAVNCQTCHRGLAVPKLLEDVLADYIPDNGVEETMAYYETLKEEYYGGFSYDFRAGTLNRLAQGLISTEEPEAALQFLQLNLDMYPNSADAYALRGEAHVQLGDTEAAIQSLERALELEPENRRLRRRLAELKTG